MSYSKQITIVLCALTVVALIGGYVMVFMRSSEAVEPAFVHPFPDDEAMQIAYDKAQDQLDYFLGLAAKPPNQTQGFAIKARILENDRQELFWVYPFQYQGDDFAGRLNDDPEILLKAFKGDIVTFKRRDIVDWTFDDTRLDIMHGNFTGCVDLARKAPEHAEQFQKLYGLDCSR